MAGHEDRALEALLEDAAGLLAELGGPGDATLAAGPPTAKDLRDAELSAVDAMQDLTGDGCVEVTIAADGMSARAHLDPPTGVRSAVDEDSVLAQLRERGVTTGIDRRSVRDAVRRCTVERTVVRDALVARGVRPVDEVPPGLAIESGLLERPAPDATGDASSVDFRALTTLVTVRAGTVLAHATPGRHGVMGATVSGEAVPYGRLPDVSPRPGSNTRREGDTVVAASDGLFRTDAGFFWIDEVLVVPGDVDFSVGNIDFPGDVVIHGVIRDGFRVRAGRSLHCSKSIDASEVSTGGDLVTAQGIIGRRQAVIRSGGGITARFIENCVVEAAGSIRVQTGIMNSSLHTLGRLEMGDRGVIVGSIVHARDGVMTAQIGSSRSPRAEIRCGIDYTVDRKLAAIRDRTIALAARLRGLEERRRREPAAAASLGGLAERIRTVIRRMNESASAIAPGLDRNEEARVSVRGSVYPGTVIEICRVSLVIPRPMSFVTFRLDRKAGRIVALRYEPRQPPSSAPPPPPARRREPRRTAPGSSVLVKRRPCPITRAAGCRAWPWLRRDLPATGDEGSDHASACAPRRTRCARIPPGRPSPAAGAGPATAAGRRGALRR